MKKSVLYSIGNIYDDRIYNIREEKQNFGFATSRRLKELFRPIMEAYKILDEDRLTLIKKVKEKYPEKADFNREFMKEFNILLKEEVDVPLLPKEVMEIIEEYDIPLSPAQLDFIEDATQKEEEEVKKPVKKPTKK